MVLEVANLAINHHRRERHSKHELHSIDEMPPGNPLFHSIFYKRMVGFRTLWQQHKLKPVVFANTATEELKDSADDDGWITHIRHLERGVSCCNLSKMTNDCGSKAVCYQQGIAEVLSNNLPALRLHVNPSKHSQCLLIHARSQ